MNLDDLPRYPGGPLRQYPEGWKGDELMSLLDWATECAIPLALEQAMKAPPFDAGVWSEEIPLDFGEKWAKEITQKRNELTEGYGDDAPHLTAFASRVIAFQTWRRGVSSFLRARELTRINQDRTLHFSPTNAYDATDWPALPELLSGLPLPAFPPWEDMLKVTAVVWFFDAADLFRQGDTKAFDMLFEVSTAIKIESNSEWWEDAEREGYGQGKRDLARRGAAARHQANRDNAVRIKTWWLENRSQFSSLDQAAEKAVSLFGVGFRTAREHIGKAKKELRSAGTHYILPAEWIT